MHDPASGPRPAAAPGAEPQRAPTGKHKAGANALPWPPQWHRPRVPGWLKVTLMMPPPLLMVPGGCALAVTSRSMQDRVIGLTLVVFGLAILLLPATFLRPRGSDRASAAVEPASGESGLLIPYAQKRLGAVGCAVLLMAIGSLVPGIFLLSTALTSPGDGNGWWPGALLLAMAGMFGWAGWFGLDRVVHPWMIALTPSGVSLRQGAARTVLPWSHVEAVEAHEFVTGSAYYTYREPYAVLQAPPGSARVHGPLPRRFRKITQRFGGELDIPLRMVGIDPVVVLYALDYYRRHPDARAELGTRSSVQRLRRRDLAEAGN